MVHIYGYVSVMAFAVFIVMTMDHRMELFGRCSTDASVTGWMGDGGKDASFSFTSIENYRDPLATLIKPTSWNCACTA